MMLNSVSIHTIINTIIPISRFNKGEANKIFDEVKESGYKIVMKNNTPACVLITPERYEEMVEQLEDYALFMEAQARTNNENYQVIISEQELMGNLGITEDDLIDIEVEIE